jgi:putative Mn2+ efflux pump MntP
MNNWTVLAIAFALALDAFTVAFAGAAAAPNREWRRALRLAWHFGLFQSLMTLLGWTAGRACESLIASYAHWLAFGLLVLVGGRMIVEARKAGRPGMVRADPTKGAALVMLSVATSLDALAVGISFSMMHVKAWGPSAAIGVVAAGLALVGMRTGGLLGAKWRLGGWAEIGGGATLIAIGLKLLHDRGVF